MAVQLKIQKCVHVCLDMGSVLKVVSITQENWSTEEIILEKLQVFKVYVAKRMNEKQHTNKINKQKVHLLTILVHSFTQSHSPILNMEISSKQVRTEVQAWF